MTISSQKRPQTKFVPIRENFDEYEKVLERLEQIRYKTDPDNFYKETAYQKSIDGKISYYHHFSKINYGYKRSSEVGGYLTHSFDIYKGAFTSQMVRALINYCDLPEKAIILDPFCGSGTTLIETLLLSFIAIGIDNNPIASLSSFIKSHLLETDFNHLFQDNKKYFNFKYYERYFSNLRRSDFLALDIKELFYIFLFIRSYLSNLNYNINPNYAFKRLYNDIRKTLFQFQLLKEKLVISLGKVSIKCNSNLDILRRFKNNSIDCILTSPPYISLIDYIALDLKIIEKFFAPEEVKIAIDNQIGRRFKKPKDTLDNFWKNLTKVMKECYRILKNGMRLILVVDKRNLMKEKCIRIGEPIGFHCDQAILKRVSNFRKKEKKIYKYEYIVILEK